MILSLIYQTIVIVLLLTFSFGPAFFALINTGIKYGYKTGSLLALGVVLSDFVLSILIIFLVHFGLSNFIQGEKSQRFMGILAGIISIAATKQSTKNDRRQRVKWGTSELRIPAARWRGDQSRRPDLPRQGRE